MALAITLTEAGGANAGGDSVTSLSFGTASSDRWVCILFTCVGTATGACSIGGVTATKIVDTSLGATLGMAYAPVPTGTTGTLSVTGGGGISIHGVWAITGAAQITKVDHDFNTALSTGTFGINVRGGGVTCGACIDAAGGSPSLSWTAGLTNRSTYSVSSTPGRDADAVNASTSTPLTCTFTGATSPASWAISFVEAPWQFLGVSSNVETTGTTLTLVTTGLPTLQAGDLLVACLAYRTSSTQSITLPTGGEWTRVAERKANNTLTTTSAVASGMMAHCVRGASDPNFAFSFPVVPSVTIGRIVAYRGVDTSSPQDTQTSFTTAVNTTAVSGTGLTTANDDELIVAMAAGGQEAGWLNFAAATDPAVATAATAIVANPERGAWLERSDNSTTTGADTSLGIFDAIKASAGATGNLSVTASLAASHVVIAGAFKRAAGGAYTLAAGAASFAFTGTAATLKRSRRLDAAGSSFSFSGTAATLKRGYKVIAAGATFSFTGTAATFSRTYRLSADGGSFAFNGQAATLKVGRRLSADSGSFSFTGSDASFRKGLTLNAEAASFSFTGTAATLKVGRSLSADAASFAFTGTDATLKVGYKLAVDAASFSFTGTAATFSRTYRVSVDAGSFSFSGSTATLKHDRLISAGAGSFSFSGTDATLTLTPVGETTIAAGSGSFVFTGSDATLRFNRRIAADSAGFSFTGTAATLKLGRKVTADGTSFAFSGSAATLRRTYRLSADAGSFAFTGSDATLTLFTGIAAGSGSFNWTGSNATLLTTRKLIADAGSFLFTGTGADLILDDGSGNDLDYITYARRHGRR